jgi:RNA polymerase sigma factor (sigma-70 family)
MVNVAENDSELIGEFNARRSEEAFAALVQRHVNLVFATALRQVGERGIAEEVTQNVFVALAQSSGKLGRHPTIAGWLYQTTLNKSRERLRSELRRHRREQVAVSLESAKAEGDSVWGPVVPLLDDALLELGERDRVAVILHFMEGQTFREVGSVLGVGEDAARKRVRNCLDQLTDFFRRRGFAIPAAAAGAPLFTLSSPAAPAGLAVSAATAGFTAAKAAGSSGLISYTLMATTQKVLIGASVVVAAGVGIYETHKASALRSQVRTLQQQQEAVAEENRQLSTARDEERRQLVALRDENERLNRNSSELASLRSEVALLRRNQAAALEQTAQTPVAPGSTSPSGPTPEDIGRELGAAVVRGEPDAFGKLVELSKASHASFNTKSVGLNDTQKDELSRQAFAPLNVAFKVIGESATGGNQVAVDAVVRAMEFPELKGGAVQCIGALAATGNEAALEVLLNPEKYDFPLSSAVSSLRGAADAGNQKAIDALATVASDSKHVALWMMTADGLQNAARMGNPVAIDALVSMSGATNLNVRKAVLPGLRAAAAQQNTKAVEALRAMGIQ